MHSPLRVLEDGTIEVIDQRELPRRLVWVPLRDLETVERAIREMWVRGAPLIGAVGAFGLAMAVRAGVPADEAHRRLLATRPTGRDLASMLARVRAGTDPRAVAEESAAACEAIGRHGAPLMKGNVMTHCNAGWLATVGWGTALAPIYRAHEAGERVHVWVSETRPRNQGLLTAWELQQAGVPFTLVADNACGHLIQRGEVDVVIVGSDRTTARGDVANKIGTYLKALAARAHGLPFYAALPSTTIDLTIERGADIPIEERSPGELDAPFPARNPAFDVTPAELVTGLITERGVIAPADLRKTYA